MSNFKTVPNPSAWKKSAGKFVLNENCPTTKYVDAMIVDAGLTSIKTGLFIGGQKLWVRFKVEEGKWSDTKKPVFSTYFVSCVYDESQHQDFFNGYVDAKESGESIVLNLNVNWRFRTVSKDRDTVNATLPAEEDGESIEWVEWVVGTLTQIW